MGSPNLECPICEADLALNGDERPGEEVFCSYCGAPVVLVGDEDDPENWEAEDGI
ncbi:MAG: lysine biosynthesis protein LysW [Deltaproteobacteria bacterium]|nr:MAG: lysine biosynthesis protein LysW [Deltaproteobacteria bacterium]